MKNDVLVYWLSTIVDITYIYFLYNVFILVQRKQASFFLIIVSLFSKLFCQITFTVDHIFFSFFIIYIFVSVLFSNCSVESEIMAMTHKVLVTAALLL